MCRFRRKRDAFLDLVQLLLLSQEISDIDAGTDIAAEILAGSITRDALIVNPTIFSIIALEAILHDERLTRIEGAVVGLHTFLQIVGMDTFSPAVTKFLLHASPGEL